MIFLIATGCGTSTTMPQPVNRQVDFAREVRPILQKHCYGCHGPMKQKGMYRLDDESVALKAEVITKGDSAASPFIQHLLGVNDYKRMPPEPPYLDDEQIGILRAWIDQGAHWSEPK